MAALNAMRTMLQRIGLSAAASQVIVDEQGLDSLNEIRLLTDDEIESLCKVVRRPGGSTWLTPTSPSGMSISAIMFSDIFIRYNSDCR